MGYWRKFAPAHKQWAQMKNMLTSPEARQILYERMLPRYMDRHFHFTRLMNEFRYRERDTAPMGIIEYVDRPGELRPANPVGAARDQLAAHEFLSTRRGRRRYGNEINRMMSRGAPPPLDENVLDHCLYELEKLTTTSIRQGQRGRRTKSAPPTLRPELKQQASAAVAE